MAKCYHVKVFVHLTKKPFLPLTIETKWLSFYPLCFDRHFFCMVFNNNIKMLYSKAHFVTIRDVPFSKVTFFFLINVGSPKRPNTQEISNDECGFRLLTSSLCLCIFSRWCSVAFAITKTDFACCTSRSPKKHMEFQLVQMEFKILSGWGSVVPLIQCHTHLTHRQS